jgi:hypothetical protein
MSDKKDPKEKQLNIAIDENVADGVYSNLAIINHSTSEFIVDFITVMPGAPKARVKSRVILTPEHAKRFQKALGENIQRYESVNGTIETNEPPPIPLNFGPAGEA